MRHILRHVRGNAVAYLSLFVALGGTSYAAATLGKNTVGAAQIKKNAVGSSELKANSVTSSKVKNGSLLAKDFKSTELGALKGATGAQGPKGDKGDKGDTGPSTGAAGGDLTGSFPNPAIAAGAVTPGKIGGVPTVRVYATGTQAVANSTNAAVNFGSEDYDPLNMHDPATPSLLTAPIAGTYAISGAVSFVSNVTGQRALTLSVPTPSGTGVSQDATGGGFDSNVSLTTQVRLAAGATVQFLAFQNSGGALNLQAFNTAPSTTIHAKMTWIAP